MHRTQRDDRRAQAKVTIERMLPLGANRSRGKVAKVGHYGDELGTWTVTTRVR